jgi:hypothetical protein
LLRLPILRFATDSDLFELANDFCSLSQPIAFGQRRLARVRRERSLFLFDCGKVLLIGLNGLDFTFGGSGHDVQFFDRPGRREAAGGVSSLLLILGRRWWRWPNIGPRIRFLFFYVRPLNRRSVGAINFSVVFLF